MTNRMKTSFEDNCINVYIFFKIINYNNTNYNRATQLAGLRQYFSKNDIQDSFFSGSKTTLNALGLQMTRYIYRIKY